MQNGLQNEAEIDAEIIQSRFWAARGAADVDFDYFLVAFLRSQIFDDFSIGEKSAKNRENGGPWLLKAKFLRFWGGSAAEAVAAGGFWSLTRSGKSLKRISNGCAPRAGAADLKAPPHAADPN